MEFRGFWDYFRDYVQKEKIQFRYHCVAKILYYCFYPLCFILMGYTRGLIALLCTLLEITLLLGNVYDHQLPLEDEVQQKRIMFHIFMKGALYGCLILLGVGFDFLFHTRTAREMAAYPMAYALTLITSLLYMLALLLDFAKRIYAGDQKWLEEEKEQISRKEKSLQIRTIQKDAYSTCCLLLSMSIILIFYIMCLFKRYDMPVLQGILDRPGTYLFMLMVCVLDIIEIVRLSIPWNFSDYWVDLSDDGRK